VPVYQHSNFTSSGLICKLVLDRVPFNGSGFGVLLKPEPDPNPMFATRNFRENFEIFNFRFSYVGIIL
jgi:hypothetical protein